MNQPAPSGQPPSPAPSGQPPSGMPSWTSDLSSRVTKPGPGGVALAGFADRAIGAFIDFLILGIIGAIVATIMTGILGQELLGGIFGVSVKAPSLMSSLATVVVMLVVSAAYFVGMWTRMGGTVGMKVMKLSVRDASSGAPVGQSAAINRWLLLGAPAVLSSIYGWGIGLIIGLVVFVYYIYLIYTTASSPTRQGLHDTYAKTVVAKG